MPRRQPAKKPRRSVSISKNPGAAKRKAKSAAAPPPLDAADVARQLLEQHAAAPTSQPPALLTRAALAKSLSAAAKRLLDPALEQLSVARALLALRHGRSQLYLFAIPLAAWLGAPSSPSAVIAVLEEKETGAARLAQRYAQLVRESGGFPDVAVADLLPAFVHSDAADTASLAQLHAELLRLWQTGSAVLSLGDWSLATPAARAAALPLAGEHYLLVRLLPADSAPSSVRPA